MPATNDYERRKILVFIFGVVLTGMGIHNFSNIWTNKFDLIQIKGTLGDARTYISMGFAKSYRDPYDHTKFQISELLFRLNEYKNEFSLTENIGNHLIDDKYEAILKGLKETDSTSVWIRKKDQHVLRPQVFQISNDETILFPFEHLHMKNDLTTAFLIVIGLFCTFISSIALVRDKFRSNHRLNKEDQW